MTNKTFQCGCVVSDTEVIKFCNDHWMDYIISGNVIYPKDNKGDILLISVQPIVNPFGKSIFTNIKTLNLTVDTK